MINLELMAKQIINNIYVDDLVIGADTCERAIEIYSHSTRIFNLASMNLREWISNCEIVNQMIAPNKRMKESVTEILGIIWDSNKDELQIELHKLSSMPQVVTKRIVLNILASNYDPMGLIAPVLVKAKIFFQKLWKLNLAWDTPVDITHKKEWTEII